jgi:signal transduction histidine kinase
MVDRDRLLQVLSNLLGNAIKFTDAGGSVTLRSSATPEEVSITVEDTGIGIPTVDFDRIFDPYQTLQTGQRGTGLGLYISRGIVERHGGTLTVQSTPGEGSSFSIALPRP